MQISTPQVQWMAFVQETYKVQKPLPLYLATVPLDIVFTLTVSTSHART